MSAKIIIERKFKEAPSPENYKSINKLRVSAMHQRGYISGETLINLEDNREFVVISFWSKIDDWKSWLNSEERSELENELAPHLEEPAKIRAFRIGADAIMESFEQFIHDADAE